MRDLCVILVLERRQNLWEEETHTPRYLCLLFCGFDSFCFSCFQQRNKTSQKQSKKCKEKVARFCNAGAVDPSLRANEWPHDANRNWLGERSRQGRPDIFKRFIRMSLNMPCFRDFRAFVWSWIPTGGRCISFTSSSCSVDFHEFARVHLASFVLHWPVLHVLVDLDCKAAWVIPDLVSTSTWDSKAHQSL